MITYGTRSIQMNSGYASLVDGNNRWKENSSTPHTITFYKRTSGNISYSFTEALSIEENVIDSPLFMGIKRKFLGFPEFPEFSFSTSILIEKQSNSFLFSITPLSDSEKNLRAIQWPAPFLFEEQNSSSYAVVTMCQGALLINGSPDEIVPRERWDLESGYNFTRTNYMPWYGLVRGDETLMAQYLDPFDTGFDYEKYAGGCAKVSHIAHSQLGRIGYERKLRVSLLLDADYNTLAKRYRSYLIESGQFVSLKEKVHKNPKVAQLIGSALIHTDIYHQYSPICFDVLHKNITETEKVVPFQERATQIERLQKLGLSQGYLHLDGWNKEGYDNQHPDTFPPTEKAGGLKGMQDLITRVQKGGFLFGIHDQYRDFYLDAPSYKEEFSVVDHKGDRPNCSLWEGGLQEVLNPRYSLDFVKRNFDTYKQNNLNLDGAYLDVFSVIALDESYHPELPLTREMCAYYRGLCLEEVRNRGILIQSEEGTSWAIPHLDFTHHLPYWVVTSEDPDQMIGKLEERAIGVPVPLSTLVFHDSIITPWTHENTLWPSCGDATTMALIHGGIPYVNIDASEEEITRALQAMKFHRLIAFEELLHHRYVDMDRTIHQSTFSSGYVLTVDTKDNSAILKKDGEIIPLHK